MIIDNKNGKLVNDDFVQDYIVDEGNYVLETFEAGGEYIDEPQTDIGEIIYPHGLVVLQNQSQVDNFKILDSFITFKSVLPLLTTTFYCNIKDYEYNYSLNPTAIDSNGNLKNNISGSSFTPYITSVGLYNDSNELLAVAKLSQPIKKVNETDMVIKIKLDF